MVGRRRSTVLSAALRVVVVAAPVFAQKLAQNASVSVSAAAAASITANATTSASSSGAAWNPSAASNPGSNPLIPQSISSACQAFLARLNSNSAVSQCTQPLVSATDLTSQSGTQTKAVLDGMCGVDKQGYCTDELVRQVLGHFAGNCSNELASGDDVVMQSYDVLYALNPFKKSLCSKSALNQQYCLSSIAAAASSANSSASNDNSNSTANNAVSNIVQLAVQVPGTTGSSFADMLANAVPQLTILTGSPGGPSKRSFRELFARQSGSASASGKSGSASASASGSGSASAASPSSSASASSSSASASGSNAPSILSGPTIMPNSSTYTSTNLPFLFLSPSFPSSVLCTPCTTSILSAFVAFEQSVPYAGGSGLNDSRLLNGQVPLWKGVGEKCGTNFLSGIQRNAGSMALASGSERVEIGVAFVVGMVMVIGGWLAT